LSSCLIPNPLSSQEIEVLKVFWTLPPQQRQNLLILFSAGLAFWASMGSLLPTLPSYVEDVGGTKQQIGIVMGAFAIGLLLCRSWLGRLADRRSRKGVLLLGTMVAAIAPFGYLFVTSIPLLIAIRAFHGISIAAFTTAYSALVVDLSPTNQRGEVIGYMSLVNPIGIAVGPAIGGLLQAWAGYTPLFLFTAGLGLLSGVGASQIQESPIAHTSHAKTSASIPFWEILFSPRLRIPSLVMLLIGLAFGALSTFVPLFIRETGVNLNAGWFYTAAAIASFGVRLFTGRASDRYGRGLFITGSLVAYTLAMLMVSLSHSAIAFLLAGVLEGAGAGTLFPMIVALISDRSLPQERGQVFALCIGGFDLGLAIAGPILGSVAEQLGYRGIFTLSTGLAFFALVLFVTQSSKNLSHSARFALGREKDIYAIDLRF
jgi:MFS family permease